MASTLKRPPIELAPVNLTAEEVLGTGPRDQPDRVSFGFDHPERIDAGTPGIRDEVAKILEKAAPESSFYLVRLACSFRPDAHPVRSARIRLRLRGKARVPHPPIAWSMEPERLAKSSGRITTINLEPDISAFGFSIRLGSLSLTPEEPRQEIYLVASGKLESDAQWDFRATSAQRLDSLQDLVLMVKASVGDHVSADVSLSARVGKFGLKAALPETLKHIKFPG